VSGENVSGENVGGENVSGENVSGESVSGENVSGENVGFFKNGGKCRHLGQLLSGCFAFFRNMDLWLLENQKLMLKTIPAPIPF
jgi:hypothetical protein